MRAMIQAFTAEGDDPRNSNDGYYFESYSSIGIHEVMLRDEPRTIGYRDALAALGLYGKVVMGVLSIFAALNGAQKVVGIERGAVARQAEKIVKHNRLEHTVSIVQGRVEDLALPDLEGEVDVLVSEWMGYGLYFENMLASVISARDRFLKQDGALVPRACSLHIQALSFDVDDDRLAFWNNVYGIDMSSVASLFVEEAQVQLCRESDVCSSRVTLHHLDIRSVDEDDLDFANDFVLVSYCICPL